MKTLSKMWHDVLSVCFRGLLSEKPDDSLFFVDVGQAKKPEQKGEYLMFINEMWPKVVKF